METAIYTIGYAHHTQESFLELLLQYHIQCVVDVRTMPYSAFHMQFNKEVIKSFLKSHHIFYSHMPEPFGIIKDDRNLNNIRGYVDFEKLAQRKAFIEAVQRLERGIKKGYHIGFMCAEKDPIHCHRSTLVAKAFFEKGYKVYHILHDGRIETHEDFEKRLLACYGEKGEQISLFALYEPVKTPLERAYEKCSEEIFIVNAKRVLKEDYDFPKPNPLIK